MPSGELQNLGTEPHLVEATPCCGVAWEPQHDLVPHVGPAATPISLIKGFISVSVTAQPAQAWGGAWVFLSRSSK